MSGTSFAHVQDDVTPHFLRMLEGRHVFAFSLDRTETCRNQAVTRASEHVLQVSLTLISKLSQEDCRLVGLHHSVKPCA